MAPRKDEEDEDGDEDDDDDDDDGDGDGDGDDDGDDADDADDDDDDDDSVNRGKPITNLLFVDGLLTPISVGTVDGLLFLCSSHPPQIEKNIAQFYYCIKICDIISSVPTMLVEYNNPKRHRKKLGTWRK